MFFDVMLRSLHQLLSSKTCFLDFQSLTLLIGVMDSLNTLLLDLSETFGKIIYLEKSLLFPDRPPRVLLAVHENQRGDLHSGERLFRAFATFLFWDWLMMMRP